MKFLIQKETHHTYLFLYLFCFILKKKYLSLSNSRNINR